MPHIRSSIDMGSFKYFVCFLGYLDEEMVSKSSQGRCELTEILRSLENRVSECNSRIGTLSSQCNRMSRFRGMAFFAALTLFIFGFNDDDYGLVFHLLGAVASVGFVYLVSVHDQLERKIIRLKHRRKINQNLIAKKKRDWSKLYEPQIEIPNQFAAMSNDLDLFGKASLFQMLSRSNTLRGKEILRDWMLYPAQHEETSARQEAVKKLSNETEFMEQFDLHGRMLASSDAGPAAFVEWAASEDWQTGRGWLVRLVQALTAINVIVVLLGVTRILSPEVAFIGFGVGVVVSLFVNVLFTGSVHEIFNQVDSRSSDIIHYQGLFGAIEQCPCSSVWIDQVKEQMRKTPGEPIELLNKLMRIMWFANLRRSALFGVIHIAIQLVFLLDFHTLVVLEKWKRKYGGKVKDWFESVGKMEAITSLATVSYLQPNWVFPSSTTEPVFTASKIGHPLLTDDSCVQNDVQIGPAGKFLLVTGSNMSGKSTLLRSVGTNAILAQMGAPVCATALELPHMIVATSMRVQDSLDDGVSFFMAELKQLKTIVDASDRLTGSNQLLLFLLDEILQGTNSVERHVAVARVIHRLVSNGAIGAVSTHDLELGTHDNLADLCDIVHFRETISGDDDDGQMTFDYKMRSGLAETTNALKLLKLVGLTDEKL